MNILTKWLRSYLPELPVDDRQLAEDLTLRGIAVEGEFDAACGGRLYEMDITTNRVDAMNHYGVAREVAAIYNVPLAPMPETAAVAATKPFEPYPVRIEADDLCGRFTARVIRGVTIKPATGVLAEYFAALGQKAISGPVDVTNFGWLAMGQPTHVFDLDKLEGSIVVRRARAGEKLMLLDGSEKTLVADDLVVADEKKALALAGVMGGWESRVTEETKNILVEAAWFDPGPVRASSRRHGLHTDASHRFERGADFNAAPLGNNLVTRLVVQQAGGEVTGPMTDIVVPALAKKTADRPALKLRVSQVQKLLGATTEPGGLTPEIVTQYLAALGCGLEPAGDENTYWVKLPSWRLDLEREIDLVEEVARVYGYNRFADTLPGPLPVTAHPMAAAEKAIRTRLMALGYTEAISSTFASEQDAGSFADAALHAGKVRLENPLSEEARLLRPSLLPGMATMIANNLNRDVREVRLFEAGAIFTGTQVDVTERESLALGLTGELTPTALASAKDAGFFELKGAVESVLELFAAGAPVFTSDTPEWCEPGRGATVLVEEKIVARFGELASGEREARKLRQPVWLATLDAQALHGIALRTPVARELSRYQAVERDFSFTFPDTTPWSVVAETLRGLGIPELTRLAPAEIFRDAKGAAVPRGYHALLVRCTFQSSERTLKEDEIAAVSARIVEALTGLGGAQRA